MKKHLLLTIFFSLLTIVLTVVECEIHSLALQALSVMSFLTALFVGVLMVICIDELKSKKKGDE